MVLCGCQAGVLCGCAAVSLTAWQQGGLFNCALRKTGVHVAFDGVELGPEFVERVVISREVIIIEGSAAKPVEATLLRQMLESHQAGDVVDFECEDADGRMFGGVGTLIGRLLGGDLG